VFKIKIVLAVFSGSGNDRRWAQKGSKEVDFPCLITKGQTLWFVDPSIDISTELEEHFEDRVRVEPNDATDVVFYPDGSLHYECWCDCEVNPLDLDRSLSVLRSHGFTLRPFPE
jgi:hypothetical protein